jgi:hypothetical protein
VAELHTVRDKMAKGRDSGTYGFRGHEIRQETSERRAKNDEAREGRGGAERASRFNKPILIQLIRNIRFEKCDRGPLNSFNLPSLRPRDSHFRLSAGLWARRG